MVASTDYSGIGVLITALGTFVTVVVAAFVTLNGQRRLADQQKADRAESRQEHQATVAQVAETKAVVDVVKVNVDTLNGSTSGVLAAADETRRIEAIPFAERTEKEQQHLDTAPPLDPPQGGVQRGT